MSADGPGPFEWDSGRARYLTHALAKQLVKLARRVARERPDRTTVEYARRLVSEIECRRGRRWHRSTHQPT